MSMVNLSVPLSHQGTILCVHCEESVINPFFYHGPLSPYCLLVAWVALVLLETLDWVSD